MNLDRIVVFAYSDLGHACLKYLIEKKETIPAVFTHADNPHENLWFPSVKKLAEENRIPVLLDPDLKDPKNVDLIENLRPGLILSFYYRKLIPAEILRMPKLGAFNMHGSLLPKYRGRAPINWAVLHGETQTGVTLHAMDPKADTGAIVDQEKVEIGVDDTAAEVQTRVTQAALLVLKRQLEALKKGTSPRRAQNSAEASYFGGRKPEDGAIDWFTPAQDLHNLVRAVTHPYPGAFGKIRGAKTFIWKSRLTDRPIAPHKPGDILIEDGHLYVACGDRFLEILRLQPEGKLEIDGAELK